MQLKHRKQKRQKQASKVSGLLFITAILHNNLQLTFFMSEQGSRLAMVLVRLFTVSGKGLEG